MSGPWTPKNRSEDPLETHGLQIKNQLVQTILSENPESIREATRSIQEELDVDDGGNPAPGAIGCCS